MSFWPGRAANCAVAVRENDDVLGVDWCDPRYPPKVFRLLFGGGGVIKRDTTGTQFFVSFIQCI